MASSTSSDENVFDIIIAEHRAVDELFEQWKNTTSFDRRKDILGEVSHMLNMHAIAEEMVLYPMTRRTVQDRGDHLADHSLEEHQEVKELLHSLQGCDEQQMNRDFPRLIESVRHHVREEEEELIPAMRANLTQDQMATMAKTFRAAKSVAPTRPHPSAPNKPPMNFLAGSVTGMIDRMNDWLLGLPK